jgi:hypothetical protein
MSSEHLITVQVPLMVFNWIQEEALKHNIAPGEFAAQVLAQELAQQLFCSARE